MDVYSLRFYQDILRHEESKPCRRHKFTYATLEEAEAMAISLMPEILGAGPRGAETAHAAGGGTHFVWAADHRGPPMAR